MITFIHTHDDIFKAVKQESSLLAIRKSDDKGNPMFDSLVFDEDRLILFRDLFFDARANVITACSAYMKEITDYDIFEQGNFDKDRDFVLQLDVPGFITSMKDSASVKMKAYLVAYIMYLWLENKSPEAELYSSRAETYLKDLKRFLEMRTSRRISKSWPS